MSKLTLEDIERILDDSDDSDDENEEMMDVFAVDDEFLNAIRSITYKDLSFYVDDMDKFIFRWYKIKIPKQDISRSIKYFLESDVDSTKKKYNIDEYIELTTVYYYLLQDKLLPLLKRTNLGEYYLIKQDSSEKKEGYGKFIIVGKKHNITGEKYGEEASNSSMEFNIKNQRWNIAIPNYFEVSDRTKIYIKDNLIDSKLKQNGNNVDKIVKELLLIFDEEKKVESGEIGLMEVGPTADGAEDEENKESFQGFLNKCHLSGQTFQ